MKPFLFGIMLALIGGGNLRADTPNWKLMQRMSPEYAKMTLCQQYDFYKKEFYKYEHNVINEKISYLSWANFVMLKEGPVDPEAEEYCK